MAACCCKSAKKSSAACLGRCDLPKHRCLDKEEVKPGPVPAHMGWLYTARDAPSHQLRCGWRPGHISCSVLRKMEAHRCGTCGGCGACGGCSACPSIGNVIKGSCKTSKYVVGPCKSCKSPVTPSKCLSVFPSTTSCSNKSQCEQPLIRIVRHAGQYSICTKPSKISNAPSGQYPLKYVLNTDQEPVPDNAMYSVEAKFNDYLFDYTSSQSSFVLDFSPPSNKCMKPCSKTA